LTRLLPAGHASTQVPSKRLQAAVSAPSAKEAAWQSVQTGDAFPGLSSHAVQPAGHAAHVFVTGLNHVAPAQPHAVVPATTVVPAGQAGSQVPVKGLPKVPESHAQLPLASDVPDGHPPLDSATQAPEGSDTKPSLQARHSPGLAQSRQFAVQATQVAPLWKAPSAQTYPSGVQTDPAGGELRQRPPK
jgi:hypothetical protein